jgi:membrane protease YdiL (CAAX protease family)
MDEATQPMSNSPEADTPASGSAPAPPSGEEQQSLWPLEGPGLPAAPVAVPEPPPAPDPPWSLKDLGIFLAFTVFTFLFINLAAAIGIMLLGRGFGWEGSLRDAFMQTPYIISMHVLWESLMLLFIYYTVTGKYGRRFWEAIRWERRKEHESAFFLGGIGLGVLMALLFQFFHSEKRLPIEELFSSESSAYLLAFFGICVAPFFEELVFRGFFYPVFERLWGMLAAVALSALLFALIHAPQLSGAWPEMVAILLVGTVLSYARGKTGSLVPPYLLHVGYNTTLFTFLYLTTDRFRAFEG